jgi:ribosomal protein S18 acetylase RimI-like enzyme
LARIMSQMCLRDLQAMGASEVLIATGLDNQPALRAYEKAGFKRRYNINEWSKSLEVSQQR